MRKIFGIASNKDKEKDTKTIELKPITTFGLKGTPIAMVPYSVIVTNILLLLDLQSLGRVMQVSRFFSNSAKDNRLWEGTIKELLTENPKLKANQSYYMYISSFKLQLINLKALFNTKHAQPEFILTILYEMVERGFEKAFLAILEKFPDIKMQLNVFKDTAHLNVTLAHIAAGTNNTVILNKLIECGVDLNARCDGYISAGETGQWVKNIGRSVLQSAAASGSSACLRILLRQESICINYSDCWDETALHDAAKYGHLDCVKLLVESGACLDMFDKDKQTPYEVAKEHKHNTVVSYLADAMQKQNISVSEEKVCVMQ